jgi:hypothetical protein
MPVSLSTCFFAYAFDLIIEFEVEEDTTSSNPYCASFYDVAASFYPLRGTRHDGYDVVMSSTCK